MINRESSNKNIQCFGNNPIKRKRMQKISERKALKKTSAKQVCGKLKQDQLLGTKINPLLINLGLRDARPIGGLSVRRQIVN